LLSLSAQIIILEIAKRVDFADGVHLNLLRGVI
jgi:hypothetical protein